MIKQRYKFYNSETLKLRKQLLPRPEEKAQLRCEKFRKRKVQVNITHSVKKNLQT